MYYLHDNLKMPTICGNPCDFENHPKMIINLTTKWPPLMFSKVIARALYFVANSIFLAGRKQIWKLLFRVWIYVWEHNDEL